MPASSAIAIGLLPAGLVLAAMACAARRKILVAVVLGIAGVVLYAVLVIGVAVMGGRGRL